LLDLAIEDESGVESSLMRVLNGRILVLDDEKGMRTSLSLLLRHAGHEVVTAAGVRVAVDALVKEFFDVVVTDLVLQDGRGLAVMEYCNKHCPKTKVIAMTGHASLDSALEALRLGAYDYVIKPFDFELLHFSIQRALEHQRMEDEIRSSKESYQALVEDLHDGYFVLKEGKVVYANTSMARLLACSVSALIGKSFVDLLEPVGRGHVKKRLQSLDAGERLTLLEEIKLEGFDGNTRSVELKLSRNSAQNGGMAIVGLCRDMTERKILWERLIKSEKLALMGEMVAGIAHELNNRLTPILGYTEMIRAMDLDAALKRRLNVVHSATLGAKNIVESLLLFARQEKPQKSLVDINQIAHSAADLVASSSNGSEVEMVLDLVPGLPPVLADGYQIEQVVANILKNAYEVLSGRGRITVKTLLKDDCVVITVADNGPGIPIHIKDHIFDPFFTTKERGRGTGLGLSICHGIVREHHGDLSVTSEEHGATFSIRLPASTADRIPEGDAGEDVASDVDLKRCRILLVEDEPEIAELLEEIFAHFNTCLACDGEDALKRLSEYPFDLIISDIRMPGLDGIELYRRLEKEAPDYCGKIIYTTGVTFDLRTQSFLRETGVSCLRKPFKVQQILDLVYRTLKQVSRKNQAVNPMPL
jgi:PAS domain S-box-containing protein